MISNIVLFLVFVGVFSVMAWMLIRPNFDIWQLEKKLKKENKYGINVKCANCDEYNTYFISIGTTVNNHIEGKICNFCKTPMKKFIGDQYID